MANGYTPDPTVTAIQVVPPNPLTLDNLNGFVPNTQPSLINSGLVYTNTDGTVGGTALTSVENEVTQENVLLIEKNVPGTKLSTVKAFASPNDLITPATPNGNSLSWKAGTLFVLQASDGASANPIAATPDPVTGVPALNTFMGVAPRWILPTGLPQLKTAVFSCISGADSLDAGTPFTMFAGMQYGKYVFPGGAAFATKTDPTGNTLSVMSVPGNMGIPKAYYISTESITA